MKHQQQRSISPLPPTSIFTTTSTTTIHTATATATATSKNTRRTTRSRTAATTTITTTDTDTDTDTNSASTANNNKTLARLVSAELLVAPVISPEPTCNKSKISLVQQNKNQSQPILAPAPISVSVSLNNNNKKGTSVIMIKKKVIQDRWICDICRIAAFDDFDEACRHEDSCGKSTHADVEMETQTQNQTQTENQTEPNEVKTQPAGNKDSNKLGHAHGTNDDAASVIKGTGVDFEDTPMLPKRLQFKVSVHASVPVSAQSNYCNARNNGNANFNANGSSNSNKDSGTSNGNSGCTFLNCEICSPSKDDAAVAIATAIQGRCQPTTRDCKRKNSNNKKDASPEVQIIASHPKSKAKANANTNTNAISKPSNTTKTNKTSTIPPAPLFFKAAAKSKEKITIAAKKIKSKSNSNSKSSSNTPRAAAFASIFQKPAKKASSTSVTSTIRTGTCTDRDNAIVNSNGNISDNANDSANDSANINVNDMSPPCISEEEQKVMLAEHRAAEFAANRRKLKMEEKERQKKREENQRLNYEAKKQLKEEEKEHQRQQLQLQLYSKHQGAAPVASIFQKGSATGSVIGTCNGAGGEGITPKRRKINSGERLESPLDLTETPTPMPLPVREAVAATRVNLARKPMKKSGNVNVKKYPPRFPCPSFIATNSTTTTVTTMEELVPGSCIGRERYESFVATSNYQESVDSMSLPNLPLYKHNIHYSADVDNDADALQDDDFLYRCFSSVLRPCTPAVDVDGEASLKSNQLWSDKYTMKSIPNDVYGDSNREVAEDLIGFINNWKDHRQQVYEARAEKAAKLRGSKKKTKKRSKICEYEDDDFLSDEDDGGLRSVYLLTGETGSGKTSMVHAAAKHCHCSLIEINTTAERGGKALKKEIEECTQSLSNVALLKRDKSSVGGILKEDDDEESSGLSLAVILIDEGMSNWIVMFVTNSCLDNINNACFPLFKVDLMFESNGDAGFWQSLGNVAKKAKCPIILTASNSPPQIEKSSNIQYEHSVLVRPTPTECISKIMQIKMMEQIQWVGKDRDQIQQGLAAISKYCGCDLRKIMNEMQVYALGSSQSRSKPNILHKPSLPRGHFFDINYPQVCKVSPLTVPSQSYSLVTIMGTNFATDGEVEVVVGNQVAPSRLIDENSILAVIPPCQIPKHVNAQGHIKNTLFKESLCTRYASIKVSIKRSNGFVVASDAVGATRETKDGSLLHQTYLEYSFPHDSDEYDNEDEGNQFTEDEIESLVMLQTAGKKCKANLQSNSAVVSCSPLPTQGGANSVDQMMELSKSLESMSDATFLRDANRNALPSITGTLGDFGTGLTDEVSSICGWEEPSLCGGASNAYMTMPTSRRDRWLLSQECNLLKDYVFNLDSNNNSTEEEENDDDGLFSYRSSEEEAYLPFASVAKPFIPQSKLAEAKKFETLLNASAHIGIIDDEIKAKRGLASHIVAPLVSHTRL